MRTTNPELRGRGFRDEGVVATILFTDIVDSTRLAAQLGDRQWSQRLAAHHDVTRELLARFRGVEVKSTGDVTVTLS